MKHTAATQRGSSGSPVLDAALAPIALHNGTRPGTEQEKQSYNTAVPLAHIVADLKGIRAHPDAAGVTDVAERAAGKRAYRYN